MSAGLLIYKINPELKVFLVYHGGPYFKDKDLGTWSIPKGMVDNRKDNHLLETAEREFYEETGVKPPEDKSKYIDLGLIKQKSGKVVYAWAFEGNWNGLLRQHMIKIRWLPKIGKLIEIPEIDKAEFFKLGKAKEKIIPEQFELVERLKEKLKE